MQLEARGKDSEGLGDLFESCESVSSKDPCACLCT